MSSTEWSLVTADAHEKLRARLTIRRFLAADANERSDLDAAELIAGELIGNAIRHAPGSVGIHVGWEGEEAILVVSDRGPGIPPVRSVPDPFGCSGRGLFIIHALAREVEIDAVPGYGSRVVVHLPVYRTLPREPVTADA